jgi:hypothetical protein
MELPCGLLLLAVQATASSPIRINHPQPEFRMTLPQGYQSTVKLPPNAVYAFQRSSTEESSLVLSVEILNGRIDPGRLDLPREVAEALKQLPPGSQVRSSKAMWGQLELDIFESLIPTNGNEMFVISVQIPTLPRAVQIAIAGPKTCEAEIRQDLVRVLGSFKGITHWLTPRQRMLALAAGGPNILGYSLLLVYGILYVSLYRNHPLRAWKFRVVYGTALVVLFGVSMLTGVLYNASKNEPTMSAPFYVQALIALAVTTRTTQLAQRGRAASSPPPSAPPAAV